MEKIMFEDLPSTKTPLNSENLNQIQTNAEIAINEVDNKFKYSTNEQIVGSWINGEYIYRKVIEATLPICETSGSFSTNLINITDLNLSQLISTNVIVIGPSFQSNLPLYTGNDPYAGVRVYLLDKNTININNSNPGYNDLKIYIIIEYIKTTI